MATAVKEKKYSKSEATGTARNHAIEEQGFDELFAKATPEEKAHGKLIGKLVNQETRTYQQIEDAFKWFEVEHNNGVQLDYRHKMLCIFQAAELLGCEQTHYNLIRKMYLTVANRS
jgi:hypothetical protein